MNVWFYFCASDILKTFVLYVVYKSLISRILLDIINFTFCRECSDIPEQAVLLNKVSTFSAKQ